MSRATKHKTKIRTLLQDFIQKKGAEYQPPVWAGKARDEKKGIKRNKFEAILFSAVTNMTQKEIAKKVGVTHGQIRIWSIGDNFKAEKTKYRDEMAEAVTTSVKSNMKQLISEVNDFLSKNIMEMGNLPLPTVSFAELSDSNQYNRELSEQIISELWHICDNFREIEEVHFKIVIYSLLTTYFSDYVSPEMWGTLKFELFVVMSGLLLRASERRNPQTELKLIQYYLRILAAMDSVEEEVIQK